MKERMKSFRTGNGRLAECLMKHVWPPIEVAAYGSVEEAEAYVTPPEFQRLKVWESVCGLTEMKPEKCEHCPNFILGGLRINEKRSVRKNLEVKSGQALPPLKKKR